MSYEYKSETIWDKHEDKGSFDVSEVILDTISKWGDADKYILTKEYSFLSLKELIRYSVLQSLMNKYVFLIPMKSFHSKKNEIGRSFLGTRLLSNVHLNDSNNAKIPVDEIEEFAGSEYVDIRTLPLSLDEIFTACNVEDKNDTLISNPFYVPGNTLNDLCNSDYDQRILTCMTMLLESELTFSFKETGIKDIDLNIYNIKYAKKANGFTFLTITDIAGNMKKFINNKDNIALADSIIEKYGEETQKYLDEYTAEKKIVMVETDYDILAFRDIFRPRKVLRLP